MSDEMGIIAIGAEKQHRGASEALVLIGGDGDRSIEIDRLIRHVGSLGLLRLIPEDSLVSLFVQKTLLSADRVGVCELDVAALHDVIQHVDAQSRDELIVVLARGAQLLSGRVQDIVVVCHVLEDGEQSTILLQPGDPGIALRTDSFLRNTGNEVLPSNG